MFFKASRLTPLNPLPVFQSPMSWPKEYPRFFESPNRQSWDGASRMIMKTGMRIYKNFRRDTSSFTWETAVFHDEVFPDAKFISSRDHGGRHFASI